MGASNENRHAQPETHLGGRQLVGTEVPAWHLAGSSLCLRAEIKGCLGETQSRI